MIVYIAGQITGDPDYKRKFSHAMAVVRKFGHTPLTSAVLPLGLTERDYMRISLDMIDAADLALFLPDYSKSEGATIEMMWCKKTGKKWDFFTRWEAEQEEAT